MIDNNDVQVDVQTNPERVVLVNKDDTQERLEKLEKKLKRLEKTELLYQSALMLSSATSGAGVCAVLMSVLNDQPSYEGIVAGIGLMATLPVAAAAYVIHEVRAKSTREKIEEVRKSVELRKEAETNPNIIIKERTKKEQKLYDKVNNGMNRLDNAKYITTAAAAGVGAIGGGTLGALLGGGEPFFTGGMMGGGAAIAGAVPLLTFTVAKAVYKIRLKKLKKDYDKMMEENHADVLNSELLEAMRKITENATQETKQEEEILKDKAEISTTLEEAYAYAKECDSRETLKRVLDCAQDPTKENMDLLKQMTTRKGGDKCK